MTTSIKQTVEERKTKVVAVDKVGTRYPIVSCITDQEDEQDLGHRQVLVGEKVSLCVHSPGVDRVIITLTSRSSKLKYEHHMCIPCYEAFLDRKEKRRLHSVVIKEYQQAMNQVLSKMGLPKVT